MPSYTPVDFDYHSPTSIEETIELLSSKEEPVILAGGQSLMTLLKLRILRPKNVIDIGKIPSLRNVVEEEGELRIGATATHVTIASSPLIGSKCGLLSSSAKTVADVQVRNRGTIGGSVSLADPSANYLPVLAALDATIVVQGPRGTRKISSKDFFIDAYTTELAKDEVVKEVRIKYNKNMGYSFKKVVRREQEYAVVNVAAVVSLDEDGRIREAKVGVGGLSGKPIKIRELEETLVGKTAEAIESAVSSLDFKVRPISDVRATGDFRVYLARIYLKRALKEAYANARGAMV
jgi:carbon-monoxide dehydrogenase medium subunit